MDQIMSYLMSRNLDRRTILTQESMKPFFYNTHAHIFDIQL